MEPNVLTDEQAADEQGTVPDPLPPGILVTVCQNGDQTSVSLDYLGEINPLAVPIALELAAKIARQKLGLS